MDVPLTVGVDRLCSKARWCDPEVLRSTLRLACEIAAEGYEGTRVGTLFTIGRAESVLASSRPLILDPLHGHAPGATHITDARLRGTIKQLCQLDGAFVIGEDGSVVGGCRYLVTSRDGVDVSLGLGTRHVAAASVSKELEVIAIVVSQSGTIRVYHAGELLIQFRAPRE